MVRAGGCAARGGRISGSPREVNGEVPQRCCRNCDEYSGIVVPEQALNGRSPECGCSAEGRQLDAVMLARWLRARLNLLTVIRIFAWSVTDEVSRFVKTNHPTREERASSRHSLFSRNEEDPTIRRAAHSRTKLSRTVRHKTRPRIQLSLPQATMWRIGATVSRIGNGR